MDELLTLVEAAGGIEALAAYPGVSAETLERALAAPDGAWSNRVSRMVTENTGKLLGMPA